MAKKVQDPARVITADFETIRNTAGLDAVAEGSGWQSFEKLAAFIFEKNGFATTVGTVKTRNRQPGAVPMSLPGRTAKPFSWNASNGRAAATACPRSRKSVIQHRERTLFYENITNENAVPVIVTLIEEEIRIFEGVPLVPVHRLNAFIGELENGADGISFGEFEEVEIIIEDLSESSREE